MSAAILREAAALMRERAEAVVPLGVWIEDDFRPDAATPLINYTASWHPAVALAVADWLDAEAHNADAGIGGRAWSSVGGQSDALAVARAYLGGAP